MRILQAIGETFAGTRAIVRRELAAGPRWGWMATMAGTLIVGAMWAAAAFSVFVLGWMLLFSPRSVFATPAMPNPLASIFGGSAGLGLPSLGRDYVASVPGVVLVGAMSWAMISAAWMALIAVCARWMTVANAVADADAETKILPFRTAWRYGLAASRVAMVLALPMAIGLPVAVLIAGQTPFPLKSGLVGFFAALVVVVVTAKFAQAGNVWLSLPATDRRGWRGAWRAIGRAPRALKWRGAFRRLAWFATFFAAVAGAFATILVFDPSIARRDLTWVMAVAVVIVVPVVIFVFGAVLAWAWNRRDVNAQLAPEFAVAEFAASATAPLTPPLAAVHNDMLLRAADVPRWRWLVPVKIGGPVAVGVVAAAAFHWLYLAPFPLDAEYRAHARQIAVTPAPTGTVDALAALNVAFEQTDAVYLDGNRLPAQLPAVAWPLPNAAIAADVRATLAPIADELAAFDRAVAEPGAVRPFAEGELLHVFSLLIFARVRVVTAYESPAALVAWVRAVANFSRYLQSNGTFFDGLVAGAIAGGVFENLGAWFAKMRGRVTLADLVAIDAILAEWAREWPEPGAVALRDWLWALAEHERNFAPLLAEFPSPFALDNRVMAADYQRGLARMVPVLKQIEAEIGIGIVEFAARNRANPNRFRPTFSGLDGYRAASFEVTLPYYAQHLKNMFSGLMDLNLARLMLRIEAHFLQHGEWPESLDAAILATQAAFVANFPAVTTADDWLADSPPLRFEYFAPAANAVVGGDDYGMHIDVRVAEALAGKNVVWPGEALAVSEWLDAFRAAAGTHEFRIDDSMANVQRLTAQLAEKIAPPAGDAGTVPLARAVDWLAAALGWLVEIDADGVKFQPEISNAAEDFSPASLAGFGGYRIGSAGGDGVWDTDGTGNWATGGNPRIESLIAPDLLPPNLHPMKEK